MRRETLNKEKWESMLSAVMVTKHDMNKLVMNYLVTEVSCRLPCSSSSAILSTKAALNSPPSMPMLGRSRVMLRLRAYLSKSLGPPQALS